MGFEAVNQIHSNGWNYENWDWAKIGMSAISFMEIGVGAALIVTGVGATLGFGLIGAGIGSLTSGDINVANGGSYWAGWAGGQIGGLISMIPLPGIAGAAGGYLSSVVIDGIDKGWDNVDLEKAGWTAVFSGIFHLGTEMINIGGGKAILPKIVAASRGFVTNIIVGSFNALFNRKTNNERGRRYIGAR